MIRTLMKIAAVGAVLVASGAAYADDPTGVLLRMRGELQGNGGDGGASNVGPCGPGTQSQPWPNGQSFRCVPSR
jgi:hypothetical protein